MATLKDYLGTIVADINHARSISDIESARMAKQYAADDVLQYYSIPRMKMQDVELTIPVGISKTIEASPVDYQPIDNNKFYSHTYQALKDVYKIKSLDSNHSKKVSTIIKREIQSLEEELKLSQNSNEYVKNYSAIITKNTKEIIINEINKNKNSAYKKLPVSIKELPESRVVENFLYEKLYDKVTPLKKQKSLEDTEVIVESDKLRDLNPNHIIQIKMKIIEQGMEWHKMEDKDGNTVSKLTVE